MAARADLVPGTVHLVDVSGEGQNARHSKDQKDIVLVPRPSVDPEDPLNWSRKRKMLAIAMVYIYTLGVGIPTTLQYSVLADITRDTGITTDELVRGTGLMFLFLGWACLFWQPIAITYGRRGVYVLSCFLCVPLMVWTAYSKTAGEWYAHRILLGCVVSPIESLPAVSIPDLFFAHERGTWMGIYVFFLFGSNFTAPLVAGWFDVAFGWRWTMHFGSMISALAAVILFFFMEETIYIRSTVEGEEIETSTSHKTSPTAPQPNENTSSKEDSDPKFDPPQTYLQKLLLFHPKLNRPTNKQMLTMMYRPLLIIILFPITAWSGFLYGINLSWYNILNGTASPVLSSEPYNWSAGLVGTAYVAPIIGAALAAAWSGIIADKFAIYLARRNKGVREPEHRLWPLAVSGVISTAGLIAWGVGASYGVHWVGLEFGLGMLAFGCITGGSIAISYNIDSFKEIGGESMVSVIVIRNTLGFGFSYAITPWVDGQGLRDCFITVGMLSLACTGSFLLVVLFGKRLRRMARERYWEYVATTSVGGL
jgi:MFS family permease